MSRRIALCTTVLVMAACDKKPAIEIGTPVALPAKVNAPAHDTSELWAFAPANTTYAAVVADGVLVPLQAVALEQVGKLKGNVWAQELLDNITQMRTAAEVDLLDADAVKQAGWDLSRGYGIFSDGGPIPLVVVSVTDRAAYRRLKGNSTLEKVGDREIDRFTTRVCAMAGARYYVCGATLEIVDAAIKPHESAIATAVKGLPAEARGDVELYADVARMPPLAFATQLTRTLGTITAAGAALRLEKDGVRLHGWTRGAMTGTLVPAVTSRPPRPDLAAMTKGAASVLRFTLDRNLLGLVGAPLHVLDHLTGDVHILTAGKGLLGAALVAEIKPGARPTDAVVGVCTTLKQLAVVQGLEVTEAGCTADLALKTELGFELPSVKLAAVVRGRVVVVTVGTVDPAALAGNAVDDAASAEAKLALTSPATVAFWTRGLDIDLLSLPASLITSVRANPLVWTAYRGIAWLLAQVYEISISSHVTRDGVALTLRTTTFASDPPDARAAYEAALESRLADRAGYEAKVAALQQRFTGTLVARRTRLEPSTPIIGPFLTLLTAGVIVAGKSPAPVDPDMLQPLPLPDLPK